MKKEEELKLVIYHLARDRRNFAIVMAIAGGLVWLFASSQDVMFKYLIQGVGMFLLFFGLLNIREKEKIFTKENKKIAITLFMILLVVLIFGGLAFLILR